MRVLLASGSPRRRELLSYLFEAFEVQPADIDETPGADEAPRAYARRMAYEKARIVFESVAGSERDTLVIGADTVVAVDNEILGKPADPAEARIMLRRLAGRDHLVFTGFALFRDRTEPLIDTELTRVSFDPLPDAAIEAYIETGLPFDRAGGYGIQDALGIRYIRGIEGDFQNVVGLPVNALRRALERL